METIKKIDKKYLPALSRIFTPVVMNSLVHTGTSGYLYEVILRSGLMNRLDTSMPLKKFFDWVYDFLVKKYRSEYIYKNAIANKVLLGRHSLNTSHMLTEFRAANCKADVVILNGTSSVYEIKSEYDTFNRLENQINAYIKIFDHVNVITSKSQLKKLKPLLPQEIGIMILTKRNTIQTIRDSKSHCAKVDVQTIFDSLRKSEYIAIIKECYGEVPDLPNTLIYKECKKLFCSLPVEQAHELMVKHLRKRSNTKILKKFVEKAPASLIAYALSGSTTKKNILQLTSIFDKPLETILMPTIS